MAAGAEESLLIAHDARADADHASVEADAAAEVVAEIAFEVLPLRRV